MDFELKKTLITVPKNTGIDGFMKTIHTILKLSRVQSVSIDARGAVTYERYVQIDDQPVQIDFEGLEPWNVIRNADIEEVRIVSRNAAAVLLEVLDTAVSANLYPIAFVVGTESVLWGWYFRTTGCDLKSRTSLSGLPLYTDKQLPNTALALCAAYEPAVPLSNTKKTFKVEMDMFAPTPVEVDIL